MEACLIVPTNGKKPTAMTIGRKIIALYDLPDGYIARWTIKSKMYIAAAALSGLLPQKELRRKYPSVTAAELECWIKKFQSSDARVLVRGYFTGAHNAQECDIPACIPEKDTQITIRDFILDGKRSVMRGDIRVTLRPIHYRLVAILASNPDVIMSRHILHKALHSGGELNVIRVLICDIRREMTRAFGEPLIETDWGRGYSIRSEV